MREKRSDLREGELTFHPKQQKVVMWTIEQVTRCGHIEIDASLGFASASYTSLLQSSAYAFEYHTLSRMPWRREVFEEYVVHDNIS